MLSVSPRFSWKPFYSLFCDVLYILVVGRVVQAQVTEENFINFV